MSDDTSARASCAEHQAPAEHEAGLDDSSRRQPRRQNRARADKDGNWRDAGTSSQGASSSSASWSWNARSSGWNDWQTQDDTSWRAGWHRKDQDDGQSWGGWEDDSKDRCSAGSSSNKTKGKGRGRGGRNAGKDRNTGESLGKGVGAVEHTEEDHDQAERGSHHGEKGSNKGPDRRSRNAGRRRIGPGGTQSTEHDGDVVDAEDGKSALTQDSSQGTQRSGRGSGRGKHRRQGGDIEADLGIGMTVAERLGTQLDGATYECMICICKVSRGAPIWSCHMCWAAFHLKCIHQWIKRSSHSSGPEFAWACPGCRYHHIGELPVYTCYCGNILQPETSPHFLAHSCGEACSRKRSCQHPCTKLCHPGPCPTCSAIGPPGQCHCGREILDTTRCGDPTRWSCKERCGQELSCGRHECPAKCHPGPCPPCAMTSSQQCYCGAMQEDRLCGHEDWTCGNVCGRLLECGEHYCERVCHSGDCGQCHRNPETWGDRCACGSTTNCKSEAAAALLVRWVGQRKKCSDPLPLCGHVCGRAHADCGHPCKRICHDGPCGGCEQKVQRGCRCSRSKKELPCSEGSNYTCTQVCRTKKTCGTHRCDTICCPGYNNRNHEDHICLQVCGRPLACGSHACEEFCHLGKCPPCRIALHEPLCCACGAESLDPPILCGTSPPFCSRSCAQVRECGHVCQAACHFGDHPLCFELVSRPCLGGHRDMKNVPCHSRAISCGEKCGKSLPCSHGCGSLCHGGECPMPCTQPCGAPRVHCQHRCEAKCHAGEPCPDTPCQQKMKSCCQCGLRVEEKLCGAFSSRSKSSSTGLGALKCDSSCENSQQRLHQDVPVSKDQARYATDLHKLSSAHKKFVILLENLFSSVLSSGKRVSLPPCDTSRRLLAVEYARLHWRLRTITKRDNIEGWYCIQVDPTPSGHMPSPVLSTVATGTSSANLAPALGTQPVLRFCGCKGFGDEIYDIVGLVGLLGVRLGQDPGEVLAFMDRGASAATIFKKLTGQDPGHLTPVRGISGAAGLCVALEQSFSGGPSAGQGPRPQPSGASSRPTAWGAARDASAPSSSTAAASSAGPVSQAAPKAAEPEPVADSWEDM
eukprot:TRINITY_DN5484_c0_g1_i1.p1 TRINITY_DN5484_c0_g1~~TRINITY_DN5484_c0_g1_i1.p1  ORF type:complete len:1090 (+),score=115.43 TRINITY_DN5484_c0_g1_i1:1400-4669(+)